MQNPQTAEQALEGLHRSLDALAQQMRGPVVKPLPLLWALVPGVAVLVTLWLVGVAQWVVWPG